MFRSKWTRGSNRSGLPHSGRGRSVPQRTGPANCTRRHCTDSRGQPSRY
jgi:hypothetical protein